MKTIFYTLAIFVSALICISIAYARQSMINDAKEINRLQIELHIACYESGYLDGIKAAKDSCSFHYYEDRFKSDSLKFVEVFNK